MEAANYKPSNHVLQHLKDVRLLLLVGPSGVGKTTLINKLTAESNDYHFVLTEMSRQPRPEEVNGRDANFHSRSDMEAKINAREYVQVAPSVFGDYYASAVESYDPQKICLMPCIAAEVPNMRSLPFKDIKTVCLLPPSFDEWFTRMGGHNFTPDKLQRRFAEARASLEFAISDNKSFFVITDTVERSAQALQNVIQNSTGDKDDVARALAQDLLTTLNATSV